MGILACCLPVAGPGHILARLGGCGALYTYLRRIMKDSRIEALEREYSEARVAYRADVRAIQTLCRHDKVVTDGDRWGGRRICAQCGLEENVTHGFSWETSDGGLYPFMRPAGLKPILDVEFAKRDDVVKYRVRL